ncbi:hypothetical protein R3W88_023508 [Solanum pinnatisectum]|uniref:Dirigent protein n=1 Tax=Solanum pinnatisectum TaxID=50273 RepID=A0AAV9M0Y6_9SOLN|nr:hypothetical protein R3W88_023508 [Solanum pinnatisectum]
MVPVADPSIPAATVAPPADIPTEPEPDSAPADSVAPPVDVTNTGQTWAIATSGGVAAAANSGATEANPVADHPMFSFFMHDIVGGLRPSGRVVTGIIANSDANNLPFSKPNNQIFPISGGVSVNNIINLANTLLQNSGNNNILNGGNNQPFVTAGQLPSDLSLLQLMFGSITVTLTALFHGEHDHEVDHSISFYGIHRTATPISHIAIIGGTGKYENAKGYASIETLPHVDQHTIDGVETFTHFTVHLIP